MSVRLSQVAGVSGTIEDAPLADLARSVTAEQEGPPRPAADPGSQEEATAAPPGSDVQAGSGAHRPVASASYRLGDVVMSRRMMLRKIAVRLTTSLVFALAVGAIPAVIAVFVVDVLMQIADAPVWLREITVVFIVGAALAVVLVGGIMRSGVKIKRRGGRLAMVVKRRL